MFAGQKQAAPVSSSENTITSSSVLGENIGSGIASGIINSAGVVGNAIESAISNASAFASGFVSAQSSQGIPGSSTVFNNTYQLNVTSTSSSQGITRDFDAMRILG